MKGLKTVCIALSLLLCPAFANAQSASYSMTFLGMPRDAAALGMGGTFASSPSLAWSTLYNPAFSSFAEEANHVSATAGVWQPGSASGVNSVNIAAAGNISDKFGFGLACCPDFGHPYSIMESSGAAGDEFSPGNMTLAAAFSFRILPWIGVGAGVKYIRQDLAAEASAKAFAASAFAYARPFEGLSVTAGAENLAFGEDSRYRFPAAAVAGAEYARGLAKDHKVSGAGEFRYFLAGSVGAAAGVKYTFKDIAHASAGYNWCAASGPYASYASFGLGALFLNIQIDVAYVLSPGSPVGNSMFITLGYKLPKFTQATTITEK